MKLTTAIEILDESITRYVAPVEPRYIAAKKLAIEALQRCDYLAKNDCPWANEPLPGETRDDYNVVTLINLPSKGTEKRKKS